MRDTRRGETVLEHGQWYVQLQDFVYSPDGIFVVPGLYPLTYYAYAGSEYEGRRIEVDGPDVHNHCVFRRFVRDE